MKLSKYHLIPALLGLLLACQPEKTETDAEDPYLWLEEVESEKSLDWVRKHNEASDSVIKTDPRYEPMRERLLASFNDTDKIAYPAIVGSDVYNFWQDAGHERGIWRRMPLQDYLAQNTSWETVLDLDSLSEKEGKKWVYKGVDWLAPANERCLILLSDGGKDESELREFDARKKEFVAGGFYIPESKGGAGWIDENTLLVSSDFGPGTMTTSGYPRMIRQWKRGTPLSSAELIHEEDTTVAGVWPNTLHAGGRQFSFVYVWITTNQSVLYYLGEKGLVKMDFPIDAEFQGIYKNEMLLVLQSDWIIADNVYKAGNLISFDIDEFLAGKRNLRTIYEPDSRSSFVSLSSTADYLVLNTLQNVQSKLIKSRFDGASWTNTPVDAPEFASIGLGSASDESDDYFFYFSNLITPNTLMYDDGEKMTAIKSLKPAFENTNLVVEQFEAKSKDGTMVPYFIVHDQAMELTGANPTLVYAYGGFNISSQPSYSAARGIGWLDKGGVYVLANIRGGGEFGPAWHQAAIREKRQNAYDDFYAVTEDLISRKITNPAHLGAFGWSNGGLMAGVVLTQRPDLYHAVIVGAPLLDMKRFSRMLAGASWMGEYGNPDVPEDWAYLSKFSPYHNVSADREYPEALFVTSTKDDRVHPGHARKMVALMQAQGHPVLYHETIEGGHGAASTNSQQAEVNAIMYTYLNIKLNSAE